MTGPAAPNQKVGTIRRLTTGLAVVGMFVPDAHQSRLRPALPGQAGQG